MRQTNARNGGAPWVTTGAAVLFLAACGGGSSAPVAETPAPPVQKSCDALAGLAIPASEIGMPTSGGTVTSAVVVPAAGTGANLVPEHCLVNASISPVDPTSTKILFRVALPTTWNNKALMFGGGGFDGSVPAITGNVSNGPTDQPRPIARGYATFGSDSGHQANEYGSQDGRWGLNDEAVDNFGGNALKKTRDASVYLIKQRYGVAPTKSYFAGGSTGGREALASIQRWPADWDGAIAWYPAWNDVAALLGGHRANRALAQPGAYPNQAKRVPLYNAAMEACDGLDGVADGLISNQDACNAVFDPATAMVGGQPLRCAGGADTGNNCLSDAQITAVKAMNTDTRFNFALASGETGYPGYNMWGADLGMPTPTSVQPIVTFLALGTTAPTNPMPRTAPYISVLVDQWIKYSVTRDATFNSLTLDPENPGVYAGRISELSKLLDTKTDISAFKARGGKLLLAHGLSDALVSSRATQEYYRRLEAQMGANAVEEFVRYYEVPGLGHAFSSVFNATWDSLTALEKWVEQGTAPSKEITTDSVGVPGRTRPMCDYPRWPRYNGSGDVNAAASFTCVF